MEEVGGGLWLGWEAGTYIVRVGRRIFFLVCRNSKNIVRFEATDARNASNWKGYIQPCNEDLMQ